MNRIVVPALLVALSTLAPTTSQAQGRSDRDWQNNIFLYGIASSIDGDARFGRIEAPVDVSFGDVLDNLQAGAMGAYRGVSERFTVAADFIFLGLGTSGDSGPVRRADLDMTVFDLTAGYRFSPVVEVFGGMRVTDISTKVGLGDPLRVEVQGEEVFYDPIVGSRLVAPLGQGGKLWLQARGDIGGFGASMDLTWQLMSHVGYKPAEWISLWAGYRALAQDFDDAGGSNKFGLNVTYHGPVFGVGFHF